MNRTGSGANVTRAGTFPVEGRRRPPGRGDGYPRPVLGAATPSPTGTTGTSSSQAQQVTRWFDVYLGPLVAILLIVVIAIIARFVLHRLIDKITDGILSGRAGIGRIEDRLPAA